MRTVVADRAGESDATNVKRMNAAAPDAAEDAPPGGPPPWINETIQQQIGWRNGDVVIAVPPKSGTTWTMNIVHQLRSGGDATFADIYSEVPWIEFVSAPDKTAVSYTHLTLPTKRIV